MLQRFLDPGVLASISSLDLLARTVVDGFVAGLHRSPDFGFSQEFAEYRAYTPGDDLRHVDWNLFARTERCYLKRYRGDTNSQLTILLDASNSMDYTASQTRPSKMDYARFAAASLFYLAIHNQRDAAGLIVFDDEVRNYIRPPPRQGQLSRLLAGLEQAEPRARTDFSKPLLHFQELLHRRGIVIMFSDFYEDPAAIVRTIEPLRYHGNEVVLFHVLDPEGDSARSARACHPGRPGDRSKAGSDSGVRPHRVQPENRRPYRATAQPYRGAGMDYHLLVTDQPLDTTLREYLAIRQGGH
jgi:uncharacterized protein (DUF58 family)